jgi:exopolysaccharide production protein ExoQ
MVETRSISIRLHAVLQWLQQPYSAIVASAFILPTLSILAGRMIGIVFIPLVLWFLLMHARSWQRCWAAIRHPVVLLIYAALGWCWLSVLWSVAPEESVETLRRISFLLLSGGLMLGLILCFPPPPEDAQRVGCALKWGMACALLCMITAIFFHGGFSAYLNVLVNGDGNFATHKLKQGNLVFTILIWPLLALTLLEKKKHYGCLAVFIGVVLILMMPSRTAMGAILLSAGCFVALLLLGRRLRFFAACCAVLMSLLMVAQVERMPPEQIRGYATSIPLSMVHRLYIWQFSIEKIQERPLLGWGVKSSNAIPGAKEQVNRYWKRLVKLPLHPHNNFLHSWLETGVVGAVLYLLLLGTILHRIHRLNGVTSGVDAACYAVVLCSFFGGMSGFGVWQSWWINSNMLIGAIMVSIILPQVLENRKSIA